MIFLSGGGIRRAVTSYLLNASFGPPAPMKTLLLPLAAWILSSCISAAQQMVWPLPNPVISQQYGERDSLEARYNPREQYRAGQSTHGGVDFSSKNRNSNGEALGGDAVNSVAHGVVSKIYWNNINSPLGNAIVIHHPSLGEIYTVYGHLDQVSVVEGQTVFPTTIIGTMGGTAAGAVKEIHLHFEAKNRPTDYSPTADQGAPKYWGYLPGHPDLYGYLDPLRFIRVNFELEEEISPLPLLNSLTRGVAVRNNPGVSYGSQESKTIWTLESWQAICATKRAVVNSEEWVFVNIPSRNQKSTVAAIHGPTGGWIKRSELVELPPSRAAIYRVKEGSTSGLIIRDQTSLQSDEVGRAFPGQCLVTIGSKSATANGEKWISFDLPETAMRNYPVAGPLSSTTGWVRLTDLNNQTDLQSIALEIVDSGSGIPEANSSISIDGLQVGITDRLGWIWVKVQELGGGLLKTLVSKADAATLELDPIALINNPTIEVKPTTTLAASSRFVVGDSVFIGNTSVGLRGRYPGPTGTTYNVLPDGAQGAVVGGPDNSHGYNRWQIRFDGFNYDMWCAEGEPGSSTYYLNKNRVGSAPASPSSLSAMPATTSQINLSWFDNSTNETGFQIERRLSPSGSWVQIATRSANVSTYSSTGLSAGTTYDFRVRGYNSAASSGYTNTATTTTSAIATTSHTLQVDAVDISVYQILAVNIYSWEGTSTNFQSNTTSFTRSATFGKQILLSAPATLAGGRIFQYWLKDSVSREYNTAVTVPMDGPHALIAIYDTTAPVGRTLQAITIIGPSAIDERSAASYSARATYTDGTTGTVSASWGESSSYASISSNGMLDAAAVSSDKSVTITATATVSGVTKSASKTVTIRNTDTVSTYTLTLSVVGGGSIGYSPKATQYAAGTVVSLHANRNSGWVFSHWTGNASGTEDDITIRMDGNRAVTAHFIPDESRGDLRVDISPPQAAAEGGQWRYRNFTDWRDSGNTHTGILLSTDGTGSVKFKEIPGWVKPDNFQVNIIGGQTIIVSGTAATYREIKGAVQVSITPPQAAQAGGRWRLNGGAWTESGVSLADVSPGTHTIEFLPVPGWVAPPNQNITVQRGITTARSGDYTPPAGFPIITSISPRTGPIEGGTTVTIEGANFHTDASVTFGGVPAVSVNVVNSTLITAVTPSRESYGTVPLSLTSSGQTVTETNGFSYLISSGQNIELVGQIGGTVLCVEVQVNTAYIGEGASFVVLDVSNPSAPVTRGRILMPGLVNGIAVSNGKAYVASRRNGLYVLDVSNPASPAIIGFYNTSSAYGVAIDGAIAYLADGNAGLRIFDVSDPQAPKLISTVDTPGSAERVRIGSFSGKKCAVVADGWGGAVRIVDVTAPASPVEISSFPSASPTVADTKIVGNILYISGLSNGLQVFDVGNPSQPILRGTYTNGSNEGSIEVVGTTVYIGVSFGTGYMRVLNASNPSNITKLYEGDWGHSLEQIRISNGFAFVAAGQGGFKVFSLASPSNPSLLATVKGLGPVGGLTVNGTTLMAGSGYEGLGIVSVSNPAHPIILSKNESIRVDGRLAVIGHTVIMPGGVVDVTNSSSPVIRSTSAFINPGWSNDVAFFGNDAVFAVSENLSGGITRSRLDRFSLSNPASPQLISSLPLTDAEGHINKILFSGNWAFVTVAWPHRYLYVVNYSTPSNPQIAGKIALSPNIIGGVSATSDSNYVYVTDTLNGLHIVDVRNKNAPVLLGTLPALAGAADCFVQGNRLHVTSYFSPPRVVVFNISDPAVPVQIATYNVPDVSRNGRTLDVIGDFIYLAGGNAGAIVLRIKDLDKPIVTITSPTPNSDYETNQSTVQISGISSDSQGVVRVTWENNRGGGGVALGTTSWSAANILLAAGVNLITVTAEDAQGNLARDTLAVTATLPDTVGPALLITGPGLPPTFTFTDASLPLTGTAADVSGVQSVAWTNDSGGSGTATGTTAWSASIPLLYGPNRITLTAHDTAGNESQTELLVVHLPEDTTPPSIAILFPTDLSEFDTAQPILNISGEAGDDRGLKHITWSNNRGGSGMAAGLGPWAVNDIPLQPGLNSITVTAEDESGNTIQDNVAVTYTPYDADSDGIPDDWEREHFGALGTASAGSDTGNTGTSDFLKHAFGIHPVSPDLRSLPHMDRQTDGDATGPVFKYRRLIAPNGLMYRVGVSWNLRDWDWSGTEIEQVGIPTPTGDGISESVAIRVKSGSGQAPDAVFFRLHVLIPPEDADGDALGDAWERQYFGGLDGVGQGSDHGNTGVSDFLKFAFGMNPAAPDRNKLPQASVVGTAENTSFRFQYHRLTSPGLLIYQVGVSDDLSIWDWSGTKIDLIGSPVPTGDGVTEEVTVRLKTAIEDLPGPRFLRLRVLGGR